MRSCRSYLHLFFLEHLQHPIGDQEATDHVDRGEHDRDRAENRRHGGIAIACNDDRAEDGNARNRIRARHQGSVESGRHFVNHFEAREGRQNEDKQCRNGGVVHNKIAKIGFEIEQKRGICAQDELVRYRLFVERFNQCSHAIVADFTVVRDAGTVENVVFKVECKLAVVIAGEL